MGICDGRVVIITGAGRGLGRAHALAFAAEGAAVVVNDLGAALDGERRRPRARPRRSSTRSRPPAARRSSTATTSPTGTAPGASSSRRSTRSAASTSLVNNAGIVRDRMFVNMTVDEWDAVIRVHLRGTFCPVRHAIDVLAGASPRRASRSTPASSPRRRAPG